MLISRALAQRRIAQGARPGRGAAWLPVVADAAIVVVVLAVAHQMGQPWLSGLGLTPLTMGLLLFVVLYIPFHGVLVMSTIWAVRSRWKDTGDDAAEQSSSR